jgi:hypothetical protein
VARVAYPPLFAALTSKTALTAIAAAIVLGVGVIVCIASGSYRVARVVVAAEVAAVLVGWFVAQAPALVPGQLWS